MYSIGQRLISLILLLVMMTGFTVSFAEEETELTIDGIITTDHPEAETDWDDVENEFAMDELLSENADDLETWELDESIDPNALDLNTELPENVINVLLVGIDTRSRDMDPTKGLQHNDVNIILSVNTTTGSVKLSSLLRDLYVTIPGYRNKSRINNAYARGGGQLAMRTVNKNFNLNIQYYVTINFFGLASIIDSMGGVDVDLTKTEAGAINTYLRKHPPAYDNTDGSARIPLERVAGVQHLDGVQAVMYARLREIDNDFKRTARQRHLLELLLKQMLNDIDVNKLMNLINTAMPYVTTNINAATLFNLALSVLQGDIIQKMRNGENVLEQHRVPMDKTYSYATVNGSSVINLSTKQWNTNREALLSFIYEQ